MGGRFFRLSCAVALSAAATLARGDDRPTVLPGAHDALVVAGPQAAHIGQLWNVILVVCTAVFCAILIGLVFALWRGGRSRDDASPDLTSLDRHERGPYLGVLWSVAVSIALLLALVVASVVTDRALARLSLANAVDIEVTGHQWWWELRYGGDTPHDSFTTANELHVPAGRSSSRSRPTT
jgi:cytochrome c oxidase subunit 2